jgi:hypothetical protein
MGSWLYVAYQKLLAQEALKVCLGHLTCMDQAQSRQKDQKKEPAGS